ncbi:MAG: hypothetical protein K2H93_07450 [Oscillospiraceae bacterium]|nr:hypothetical protein [Oscillospiraceae bacterium]
MKKFQKIACLMAGLTCMINTISIPALAEGENYIYGTMNIPYADFYRAELENSNNAYEVDAVSSATNTKWSKNGEGELFEGSYGQANKDGSGQILGVTYPVAITQEDLEILADNNYNFQALDSQPEAYKIVTVTDGKANFSAVQDENPETFEAILKLNTGTAWGDYQIDVETAPENLGAIYGAILKTQEGNAYAMRHEQNIWRGEFAWSSGIKTSEPHGNMLDYENFESLMGETITEIIYIAKSGYYTTVNEGLYIPIKFNHTLEVANNIAGTGTTVLTLENFPDDYDPEITIADNFVIADNEISYTDALAGSYTLNISDKNNKYADFSTSFILSTEDLPVAYDKELNKLIPADGFTEQDASNFIKNIATVNLNEKNYSASGKGSVKIVQEDGTVDFTVENRGEAIFDGSGNYNLIFTATGYANALTVALTAEAPTEAPTEAPATTTQPTTTSKPTTTTRTNSSGTSSTTVRNATANNTSNNTSNNTTNNSATTLDTGSPKTGDKSAIPVAMLVTASLMAILSKKKK